MVQHDTTAARLRRSLYSLNLPATPAKGVRVTHTSLSVKMYLRRAPTARDWIAMQRVYGREALRARRTLCSKESDNNKEKVGHARRQRLNCSIRDQRVPNYEFGGQEFEFSSGAPVKTTA